MDLNRESAPSKEDVNLFLNKVNFNLPEGYLEFMKESNGADITNDENYAFLWPITDLFDLNSDYEVSSFASDFFLFGSDGGGTAYAIQKLSGKIYTIPFIGMSNQEASLFCNNFDEFLNTFE